MIDHLYRYYEQEEQYLKYQQEFEQQQELEEINRQEELEEINRQNWVDDEPVTSKRHRLVKARTSLQFDNDLQPFLINGTDLLPLSDEYIKLAKQMLVYIPILPTNERVYDLALYLSMYEIEDIESDFNKYLQLCKQYLVQQNIINDKTQTTKYAKKLVASLDNLFEIQQEIDVQLKKKYGDPVYIGPQDKLYTYNQVADEYENYGDDYYSLDEWAVMNGYRKFSIYDKKFHDANYVFNWCRKYGIQIDKDIVH